jgi:hypothetical protein
MHEARCIAHRFTTKLRWGSKILLMTSEEHFLMRQLCNVPNHAVFESHSLGCEHFESPQRAKLPTALFSQALLKRTRGRRLLGLSFINIFRAKRDGSRDRLVLVSEVD